MLTEQWVRKYRPTKIEDYVFQDEKQREKIQEYVAKKSIPHLLLFGLAGTGKTSLAKLLISSLDIDPDMDVLEIDASAHNSVDDIRNSVLVFCKTSPMGAFKVVHLKECDYLSLSAQQALLDTMEEYDFQCRFILTCNNVNKVLPSVRSRCTSYEFKNPSKDNIAERIANILLSEGIEPNEFMFDYIDRSYPDIRSIIMSVENGITDGILRSPKGDGLSSKPYLTLIAEHIERGDWSGARTTASQYVGPEDWEDVYRFMYQNLDLISKDVKKQEQAIVIIAEYLYKHSLVADPEINACAMFIMIGNIK